MPETVADAVDRLTAAGYVGDFRAVEGGLRDSITGRIFAADELVIDELLRFEGATDPDDEALVLALRSRDGSVRGTYAMAYGPAMDPHDAEAVRRLRDGRGRGA